MTQVRAHGRIYDSILDTIGQTPIVKLSRLGAEYNVKATLLGKCEFFNPLASVKDRIGAAMIETAEQEGQLTAGGTIVEPTSGNTGIALAFVCAAKGYRLILTMPESMSIERRKMLKHLGAEIVLTPPEKGMGGAIAKAHELVDDIEGAIILQQFQNPANPSIHMRTTAEEIIADLGGEAPDILVAGVGTGGTITGISRILKEKNPDLHVVAVEPEDSAVLSGNNPGPHKIQGIGAGFVPDNLETGLISEILRIGNETAFTFARQAAKLEGLPIGISSGAAIGAAVEIGQRTEMAGKKIVIILPSFAERYLSTALFEE